MNVCAGDFLQYREIPRNKMNEGIKACERNVLDFLQDAKLVIEKGRLNHAYVSVQFAIEELGKLVILKDAFNTSKSDNILVEETVFKSHKGKSDKAWTVLDPTLRKIYDGVFNDDVFNHDIFETDTKAEYETRLDCAFVDFRAGSWHIGRNINRDLLIGLVNHIEEKLHKI